MPTVYVPLATFHGQGHFIITQFHSKTVRLGSVNIDRRPPLTAGTDERTALMKITDFHR
ncbi:MAG: hypothetical protein KF832_21595 [Caldilineaceae bacterium]|nr:hypothetical protein [Caldilineaceae bacterium]